VRKFAAANFFSVSLYRGRRIAFTRRSNSHSDAVKLGMHTLTKKSCLIVTDCEYRIEYSRTKGDKVSIKKVVAMHNHDGDVHSAARSSKLSGKSTENVINATYPVLLHCFSAKHRLGSEKSTVSRLPYTNADFVEVAEKVHRIIHQAPIVLLNSLGEKSVWK
jgi:hypothetical protein